MTTTSLATNDILAEQVGAANQNGPAGSPEEIFLSGDNHARGKILEQLRIAAQKQAPDSAPYRAGCKSIEDLIALWAKRDRLAAIQYLDFAAIECSVQRGEISPLLNNPIPPMSGLEKTICKLLIEQCDIHGRQDPQSAVNPLMHIMRFNPNDGEILKRAYDCLVKQTESPMGRMRDTAPLLVEEAFSCIGGWIQHYPDLADPMIDFYECNGTDHNQAPTLIKLWHIALLVPAGSPQEGRAVDAIDAMLTECLKTNPGYGQIFLAAANKIPPGRELHKVISAKAAQGTTPKQSRHRTEPRTPAAAAAPKPKNSGNCTPPSARLTPDQIAELKKLIKGVKC